VLKNRFDYAGIEEQIMKKKQSDSKFSFLLPVGLGIGIAIGALIHNIGAGLAIGAGIGTVSSLIGWYLSSEQTDEQPGPWE
jgi:zinc transporter ZupT